MTVVLSHRFSTVLMADFVIVLRDGAIEEAGDHARPDVARRLLRGPFGIRAKAYD